MFNFLHRYLYLIIAILLMVFAFFMYWGIVGNFKFWEFSPSGKNWAEFGSYAGGIFSALAFLVVVYQNYQRDKEQKKQDFEKTFFMMLEQHNLKLNTLGQETIDEVYDKIISNSESFDSLRNKIEIQEKSKIYSEINSYFLLLYRILKFISENSELNYKNNYSSLLRSFLSNKLLVVLSYHLSDRDGSYGDYIKYVNNFSFLEHINFIDLELEFIHQLTGVDKETLYDLFLKNEKCLRDALEKSELLRDDFDSSFSESFLKEVIQSKQERRSITYKYFMGLDLKCVKDRKYLKAELKYEDNIFFQILKTFSLSAFGKNKEYAELILTYQNIVTSDKE